MDGIVDGEHLVKSVHKEPETERERVHYFDEAEARMLGVVLADHPCFQEKAARVAAFPLDERRIRAREEALSYVPYEGQRRDVVVRLLLDAATVDERMPSGLKDAATVDERGPGLIAAFRRDVLANSLSRGRMGGGRSRGPGRGALPSSLGSASRGCRAPCSLRCEHMRRVW